MRGGSLKRRKGQRGQVSVKGLESSPRPLPSLPSYPPASAGEGSPFTSSTPDTKQRLQPLAVRSLDTKYFCFVVS